MARFKTEPEHQVCKEDLASDPFKSRDSKRVGLRNNAQEFDRQNAKNIAKEDSGFQLDFQDYFNY